MNPIPGFRLCSALEAKKNAQILVHRRPGCPRTIAPVLVTHEQSRVVS